MPVRRRPRRFSVPRGTARSARRLLIVLVLALAAAVAVVCGFIFRSLVTDVAVAAAKEAVGISINGIVKDVMTDGDFDSSRLVTVEKDARGSVTSITTNVAAVNMLAAEILDAAIASTEKDVITVGVPLGDLTGSALFLNRGPSIPVKVTMLASSVAGFRSELTGAGINQTRHQILLDIRVDMSLLMPWRTVSTSLETEILVSETVVVGGVPETYMNWENGT